MMYANKSLARKFVFVFIRGRGIWDSKISEGGWCRGGDKFVNSLKIFTTQKIFLLGIKLLVGNKKGVHMLHSLDQLTCKLTKGSFLSYKHTILENLTGFKFFEPGAKVAFSEHIYKFLAIYFTIIFPFINFINVIVKKI